MEGIPSVMLKRQDLYISLKKKCRAIPYFKKRGYFFLSFLDWLVIVVGMIMLFVSLTKVYLLCAILVLFIEKMYILLMNIINDYYIRSNNNFHFHFLNSNTLH